MSFAPPHIPINVQEFKELQQRWAIAQRISEIERLRADGRDEEALVVALIS